MIYGNCANQSFMALALVRCSIEADQGGSGSQGKGKFGKLGGRGHVVLFMAPLGSPSARLPFQYYNIYLYISFSLL